MKISSFLIASSVLLATADVAAADLAALQYDLGNGVDTLVRSDVESALNEAASASSKWKIIDLDVARGKLNPIVRDCFTSDCLVKAGQQTGADAGLRLKFTGEAQIYDWSLEIYDLRNGALLESRKGACELCGRSELVRTFKASAVGALDAATLGPVTQNEVKPKVETKPVETDKPAQGVDLVRLDIQVEPPDATITFRDAIIGRGRVQTEVGPGSHEFRFEAQGYRIVKEMVVVEGDSPSTMSLRVHLPKKDAAPQAVEVSSRGPIDKLGEDRNLYGWIGVGTGVLLLGTSAYMSSIDGEPTCDQDAVDCPDIYDTDGLSYVATFAGTALLTGGLVLLVWEALSGSDDPGGAKVAPTVSPEGAGVGVFGRF